MIYRIFIYFIITCLSSCSELKTTNLVDRFPSNSPSTFDDAFSIKSSTNTSEDIMLSTKTILNERSKLALKNQKIDLIETTSLSSDTAFKIELAIEEDQYIYRILHSPEAFKDHTAIAELITLFKNLMPSYSDESVFATNYAQFEMYLNAKENNLEAINNFLKLRTLPIYEPYYLKLNGKIAALTKERVEQTLQQIALNNTAIKAQNKFKKAELENRKKIMDELDKAEVEKQIKTLVAKNDRKGVVHLLKQYLPFEEMPPFEKKFWEYTLEVIANPLPIEKRVLIFRGLDDDLINTFYENGKELNKELARKEGKVFFMSTMLTKNQGSYNRRLRSLNTMYKKAIGTKDGSSEFSSTARKRTMIKNHSYKPEGSPFLSFTSDLNTAYKFGANKTAAFLIDPRALHFNFTSKYFNEREFLSVLFTFPDELAGYWDRDFHSSDFAQDLQEQILKTIESKIGKANTEQVRSEIEKNSRLFFKSLYSDHDIPLFSSLEKFSTLKESELDIHSQTLIKQMSCTDIFKTLRSP